MFAAAAAKRRRRKVTKRYLDALGVTVDKKTLHKMTRATQRRIPWYRSLAIILPTLGVLGLWYWLFWGVTRVGGAWWYIALNLAIIWWLPTMLAVLVIRTLIEKQRRPALYKTLREEFDIPVCTTCGYDLRGAGGLNAPRCPECGTTFNESTANT